MKHFLTRSIAAAALICAGAAAHAGGIDFDTNVDYSGVVMSIGAPYGSLMVDGDVLVQGSYFVNSQNPLNTTGVPDFSLIGQISNGGDATSCLDGVCPTGNTSNFLSVYNDGIIHVGNTNGTSKVTFSSADVAFIKAGGDTAGTTGMYMAVEADRSDGSYSVWAVPVSGVGSFATLTATAAGGLVGGQSLGGTGSLISGNVTDLFFYAYYCNPTSGSCSAFKTNKGQFAIDNIMLDVTAVPEPSQWLLMLAGMTAVGAVIRRRRSA